jgi:hypothetical protein
VNTTGKAATKSNLASMNIVGGCKFQMINEKSMKWETLGTDSYTPKHINDFMKKNKMKWVWVYFCGEREIWNVSKSKLAVRETFKKGK